MRQDKLSAQFMTEQLLAALERDDTNGVADCLAKGARANAKTQDGTPFLFVAISKGNIDAMRAMIDAGAGVNVTDKLGFAALDHAAGLYADSARREIVADYPQQKVWDALNQSEDFAVRGDGRYSPKSRQILRLLEKSGARKNLSDDPQTQPAARRTP